MQHLISAQIHTESILLIYHKILVRVSEMIEIMQGLPENVIGAIYRGTVTGKDYDDVLRAYPKSQ